METASTSVGLGQSFMFYDAKMFIGEQDLHKLSCMLSVAVCLMSVQMLITTRAVSVAVQTQCVLSAVFSFALFFVFKSRASAISGVKVASNSNVVSLASTLPQIHLCLKINMILNVFKNSNGAGVCRFTWNLLCLTVPPSLPLVLAISLPFRSPCIPPSLPLSATSYPSLRFVKILPVGQLSVRQLARPVGSNHRR